MPAATVGLDTSFLVSLSLLEHVFHEPTRAVQESLRHRHAGLVVASHALLECFSVLTRLPPPRRVDPVVAERFLLDNFSHDTLIPGVTPNVLWSCLREIASTGLAGGKVYDAIIAHSTFQTGANVLLTWNVKDFLLVAPSGLEVLTPTEYLARAPRVH